MQTVLAAFLCLGGMTSSYHIGNSLTAIDANVHVLPHRVGINWRGAANLNLMYTEPTAAQNWYWSENGSKAYDPSIADVVGNPDFSQLYSSNASSPYGNFQFAFSNYDWDYVSLQTYHGNNPEISKLSHDKNVFQQVALLEPNAQLLFYQGYPGTGDGTQYSANWTGANQYAVLADNPTNPRSANRRAYTEQLETELASAGLTIGVIHTGDILYEIDQLAMASNFPGGVASVNEFFKDFVHLNADGDYIAYATTYHTIYGVVPPSIPAGFAPGLSVAQIDKIHELIETININPGSIHHQCVPEPAAWMFGLIGVGLVGCLKLKRFFVSRRQAAS